MSREDFAAQYGADPDDVLKVEAYAGLHHLVLDEVNLAARTVVLRGRTADMQDAFGVTFKLYATEENRRFRGREGTASVPDELDGIIVALMGLDDRPVASRWVGSRPSTPDSLPVIGRSPRAHNVFYAFGHGHLGVTFGAITGKLIAQDLDCWFARTLWGDAARRSGVSRQL